MNKERRGITLFFAIFLAATLLSAPVCADSDRRKTRSESSAGAYITRDQAAAAAQKATGGLVLKVQLQRNKSMYRVRVLMDGERVRTVRVDARTGRVLN